MHQFQVTGMSCAACSARVEKAVSAVSGVRECSVNLLTGSMSVVGEATPEVIIAAVEHAGYGATLKEKTSAAPRASEQSAPTLPDGKKEQRVLQLRLIFSLVLLAPLMYLSMFSTMGRAAARIFAAKSDSRCASAAAACHGGHGHQSKIFRQRLYGADPRRAQHGHAGLARLGGIVSVQPVSLGDHVRGRGCGRAFATHAPRAVF